ncbi:MAG: Hsp20/alpha crystallin family protein [bacterium]
MAPLAIPVNMYAVDNRIMITAPVPGMEPASISIQVDGRQLLIRCGMRGPGQERTKEHLMHEWTVGPYCRAIDLTRPVDVRKANASYHNGVLVIILPTAKLWTSGSVTMRKVGTAKGQIIHHVGHNPKRPGRRVPRGRRVPLSRVRG